MLTREILLVTTLSFLLTFLFFWGVVLIIKKIASQYPPAAPEKSAVSGVGGWLLLLVFCFTVLSPLMNIGQLAGAFMNMERELPELVFNAEWRTYKFVTWTAVWLMVCLSFYVGCCLITGRSVLVVKNAKVTLWVNGPVGSFIVWIFIPVMVFGDDRTIEPFAKLFSRRCKRRGNLCW
jgi:hypothetical protein